MVILGITRVKVDTLELLKPRLGLERCPGRGDLGSKIGQNFEILVFQDIDIYDDIYVFMVILDVNMTSVAPLESLSKFLELGRGRELADWEDQNRSNWSKF